MRKAAKEVTVRVTVSLLDTDRMDGETLYEYNERVHAVANRRIREALRTDNRIVIKEIGGKR
jgi:hypothetical protein